MVEVLKDRQPKPYVGRLLAGRYSIVEQIGAGGMARVYRGRHVTLGRPVAIKVLRENLAKKPTFVGRFLREARATARVCHRNVVEVLDFGQEPDGTVYCVMELLPGEPLSATLAREGKLDWQRTKQVMLQICAALEAAHEVGVVHRDIKPDNCLRLATHPAKSSIGSRDRVKIIDFGIAKMAGENPLPGCRTVMGTVMGTADYMAPEQARGAHTDHRTDVYGAGVLMYELLTGQVPFAGSTNLDLLAQHLYVLPEPPSRVAPLARIPPAVDAAVLRALSKDPEARFQTVGEMRAVIEALEVDGKPQQIPARAPSTVASPRRRSRRARLGAGVAAVLAVGAVGLLATPLAAELVAMREELSTPMEPMPAWVSDPDETSVDETPESAPPVIDGAGSKQERAVQEPVVRRALRAPLPPGVTMDPAVVPTKASRSAKRARHKRAR
jgi:eukaryotic-like serine/threonine-protein kinase